MSEFNNQATKTATYTQDISYAELDGANRGQRPDLLAREQGIYRTPDGKLYSVQGTQLLAADNIVPTLKTDPLTERAILVFPPNKEVLSVGAHSTLVGLNSIDPLNTDLNGLAVCGQGNEIIGLSPSSGMFGLGNLISDTSPFLNAFDNWIFGEENIARGSTFSPIGSFIFGRQIELVDTNDVCAYGSGILATESNGVGIFGRNLTLTSAEGSGCYFGHTVPSLVTYPEGNVAVGLAARATTDTDGFAYIPEVAGTPTSLPTDVPGFAPICFQPSANKLWIHNGTAWKSVTLV